jgi:hypothetical protein
MTYATNQFFDFFLYGLVENLIIITNQEQKVLLDSWFSIYSGLDGSPVFRQIFFSFFFKKHDVLKLYFDIFFFVMKNYISHKNVGS